MFKATEEIKRAFDARKLKYHIMDNGEVSAVEAGISGEKYSGLEVVFFSPDDDNDVAVRIMKICKVPSDRMAHMLVAVNKCNEKFRYVKLVIDKDRDVNLEYDMPLKNENVGDIAVEMLVRIMKMMEEIYPVLMKAMYA